MPSSYILRGLSREESRDFKNALERAKAEGRSLRWIIGQLVGLYARVGLEPLTDATVWTEKAGKSWLTDAPVWTEKARKS